MRKNGHRGISVGTILMVCLSVLVMVGTVRVIRYLSGGTDHHLTEQLMTMDFSEVLPERTIDEIPIQQTVAAPRLSAAVPVQATPEPAGGQVHLTFGGTIALETAVRQSGYYSDTRLYDFSEILSLVTDDIRSDFSMAPLENLVVPDAKVSDLIAPDAVMGMLTAGGFDGVALGFGKIYDRGFEALRSTVQSAQNRGLTVFGAYTNEGEAALSSHIRTIGNVKVALLHYTESLSSAGRKCLRKDGNSFAVWGTAGKAEVTSAQKKLAAGLCAAGADVIIGNGPRRVQTVEWISSERGDGTKCTALCAYSLGCLLSSSTKDSALQSILLHVDITVDEKGSVSVRATYTPTFTWRYKLENLMQYRVLAANGIVPDGMSTDQQKKMATALASVEKRLKGSAAEIESE